MTKLNELKATLIPVPASNITNNTATLEHAYDNTRDVGDNSHDSEGTTTIHELNTALVPVTASNVTNNIATLEDVNDNTRDVGDNSCDSEGTATIQPQIQAPKPMAIASVAHAHTHLGQYMCVGTVNIRKAESREEGVKTRQREGQNVVVGVSNLKETMQWNVIGEGAGSIVNDLRKMGQ